LLKIAQYPIFSHICSIFVTSAITEGLFLILQGLDSRFALSEANKVPKELLSFPQTSTIRPGECEPLHQFISSNKARKLRGELFQVLKGAADGGGSLLEWAFSCNEFREYVLTFCELPVDAQRNLIRGKGVQLNRLLFCMDRLSSASVFKLALV
jgi:hypothetical protein